MTMIAHYPFNGNPNDRLGKYPGTPSGSVAWVNAKQSQGLECNGVDAYININAVAQYLHGKPEASIALWVKKDAIQYGFLQLSGHADDNGNLYPYQDENRVYLDVFRTNRIGPIITPSSVLEWHHVVITQQPGRWCYYFNGELVLSTTANDTVATNYHNGEIGRNSNHRYALGKFDDVRIYDHALSASEVYSLSKGRVLYLPLMGKSHDVDDTSAVLVDNVTYEHDDVLNRPVAVFNGSSYIRVERPLGQRQLDQGWTVEALIYRTDLTGQQFLVAGMNNGVKLSHVSSSPNPIIYLNSGANDYYAYGRAGSMPSGRWLHVVFTFNNATSYRGIYVDGKDVSVGGPNSGIPTGLAPTSFDIGQEFKGKMAYFKIYATSMSASEVEHLYRRTVSVDEHGRIALNQTRLVETGQFGEPIADYSVWKDDGSIGSVGKFISNGAANKNTRVTDEGPYGEQAVLWQANNTDVSSTADGGWNSNQFPIDNSKRYRFSVWMRRKVAGNGSGYWGCHGYGSVNGVVTLAGGSPNSNPYFWSGGVSTAWRLYVGFIHPHTHGSELHPDNGIYDQAGNRLTTIGDFKWLAESTHANHRAYLYYSTDTSTIQQFAYPRVDVCDGTEPSLSALIGGVDLIWSQNKNPSSFGLSQHMSAFRRVSEIGDVYGLAHMFPFDKDYRDVCSPKVGTPINAPIGPEGVTLNGAGEVDLGSIGALGDEWTIMCVYKSSSFSEYTHLFSAHAQGDFAFKIGTAAYGARPYWTSIVTGSKMANTTLLVGQTYHLAVTYKAGVLRHYLNGQPDGSHNLTIASVPTLDYRVGRYGDEYSRGIERDLRIYRRALSPMEVARQAGRRSLNRLTQSSGDGLLFAKELSEVD